MTAQDVADSQNHQEQQEQNLHHIWVLGTLTYYNKGHQFGQRRRLARARKRLPKQ